MLKYDFFDLDMARKYCNGCILMTEGVPVVVQDVKNLKGKGMLLNVIPVGGREKDDFLITVDDETLSFDSVPLGWLNASRGNIVYLTRTPARMWKVGVCKENLTYSYMTQRLIDVGAGPHKYWGTAYLRDCILGQWHMKWSEHIRFLKANFDFEGAAASILDRRFAIIAPDKVIDGLYNRIIGKVEKDRIVLEERYVYLTEILQVTGAKVA